LEKSKVNDDAKHRLSVWKKGDKKVKVTSSTSIPFLWERKGLDKPQKKTEKKLWKGMTKISSEASFNIFPDYY